MRVRGLILEAVDGSVYKEGQKIYTENLGPGTIIKVYLDGVIVKFDEESIDTLSFTYNQFEELTKR